MTRRLLGPAGGAILFFLVATLVLSVLGWLTHSALQVERAQRESAARAELESNLRVALWRLDGRMLPAFGVEDSRPFYHYGPVDPNFGYGVAATPLLVTILPDWMKLHFQLDEICGWDSPQVLHVDVAERIRAAWPDLPLRNLDAEREKVLAECRRLYSALELLELFASRDRAIPANALSLAAPLFVGENLSPTESRPTSSPPAPVVPTPKAPAITPVSPATQSSTTPATRDSIRFLGIEICIKPEPAIGLGNSPTSNQLRPDHENMLQSGTSQSLSPGRANFSSPLRTLSSRELENSLGTNDTINRAGTINRGMKDVQAPPATIPPKGQAAFASNSLFNDQKMVLNTAPAQLPISPFPGSPATPAANTPIPGKPGGMPSAASAAPRPGGVGGGGFGASGGASGPGQSATPLTPANSAFQMAPEVDRQTKEAKLPDPARNTQAIAGPNDLDALKKRDQANPGTDRAKGVDTQHEKDTSGFRPLGSPGGVTPPATPERAAPLAIHLGSMRPHWVIGSDGAEMLVLVRVATVDDKHLCQGIILDWVKLAAMLKDEIKDLFPDAKLSPVKDVASVSPDRVMTALPIQLDPGPQPEPPPAGWTTLRLGLVLAWVAALIAFAAVGFCGWSLIDLAERRIRFVSAVTHELRTPLTSLRLYLDLLLSGMIQDEAKKQEYLNTLATESDRLHRLIDNVLDFARLEKRRKDGDFQAQKIGDLLEQLRQTWTARLAQDGKELVVISLLEEGREIHTDAAMLQQIVCNLIDNARKYSREASDRRIWLWAKPGTGKTIAIEVEDRGPGVPANERRSIFKPFRRGEQADRTSGGAGLGLALAKSWAEVLGGKLSYRPADGGTGACFRLELGLR